MTIEDIESNHDIDNENLENENEQNVINNFEENINPQLDDNNIAPNEEFWNNFDEVYNDDDEEIDTEPSIDHSWFEDTPSVDSENSHCSLQEKLCMCTDTSKMEAITMALSLAFKHSWTWESTIDTLSMINSLFGSHVVPATKYKLFKLFPSLNDEITYHVCCKKCMRYIEKFPNNKYIPPLTCDHCHRTFNKSNLSYFLTFNLQNQLQKLLKNPEIQETLRCRFQEIERGEFLNNIYDGDMYKEYCDEDGLLGSAYNLSYTFSTDGCQTSKSSRIAAWPIYIMLHELPPYLRTKNILMAGLWVSDEQPNMNMFLKPFVEEVNLLSDKGIQWTLDEEQITSKVLPLCGCFDSAARCKVLHMKQYNGYYGCTFCKHPDKQVEGVIKFPISTEIPEDRTDKSIKEAMIEMAEEGQSKEDIDGVRGPSTLMNLQYFDLVNGMVPDYMHAVLLGVIKQHTDILFSNTQSDYYIGDPTNVQRVNRRLLSIKHPSCITRAPRKIEEREKWKASEWRSWLLFYSLLCLEGILNRKYLHHLALLVSAINLLLSENLSHDIIDTADKMLVTYVAQYQQYFYKSSMTYNVHLLLHLYNSVSNWGPLYTHNAFCFENENRILLEFKKSPAQVMLQVAKKYFLKKSLMSLTATYNKSVNFKLFCEQTLSRKLKNALKIDDVIFIGKGLDYELNITEKVLVNYDGPCKIFNRMIVNSVRYTSELYRQCKKLKDYIIKTKCGQVGCIIKICFFPERVANKILVFYKEILPLTGQPFHPSLHLTINHIQQCQVSDSIQECNPNAILKHAFLVRIRDRNFYISILKGCFDD